jgi:hypothetical protein
MFLLIVVLLVWSLIPIALYHYHLAWENAYIDIDVDNSIHTIRSSLNKFKRGGQSAGAGTETATATNNNHNDNDNKKDHKKDTDDNDTNDWWWDNVPNVPRRFFVKSDGSAFYAEPPSDTTQQPQDTKQQAAVMQGAYHNVPRFPYDIPDLVRISNPYDDNLVDNIRHTMQHRLRLLQESDTNHDSGSGSASSASSKSNNHKPPPPSRPRPPKYLPPQFPQRNRYTIEQMALKSTITGLPPQCCAGEFAKDLNDNFSSKRYRDGQQDDCTCRAGVGENYNPRSDISDNGDNQSDSSHSSSSSMTFPATIVTAFYAMKSKHRPETYKRYFNQMGATSDPMIVFADLDNTPEWFNFFVEARSHAPTVVVPLMVTDLSCASTLPLEDFWHDRQSHLDLERSGTGKNENLHKGVSMQLYAIWCEKLALVQAATLLNPFNTTGFVWADAGFARTSFPHLYRQPVFRQDNHILQQPPPVSSSSSLLLGQTGIPHPDKSHRPAVGVSDHSVLLFHMRPYHATPLDESRVWNPHLPPEKMFITGGNCYAGSLWGFDHLYSAYYDTLWSMFASTSNATSNATNNATTTATISAPTTATKSSQQGVFAGEDQCTMYRTCHMYPDACHIHLPKRGFKKWMMPLQLTLTAMKTIHEEVVGADPIIERRRTKLLPLSQPRVPRLVTPPLIANSSALDHLRLI